MAKILIVDDESDILFVLRVTLEAAGFEVIEALDGESAVRTAFEQMPDIIVTDLMMPFVDGIEVIRRLRADPVTAGTRIVIVSARQADVGQADAVIRKPWRSEDLIRCLNELLDR